MTAKNFIEFLRDHEHLLPFWIKSSKPVKGTIYRHLAQHKIDMGDRLYSRVLLAFPLHLTPSKAKKLLAQIIANLAAFSHLIPNPVFYLSTTNLFDSNGVTIDNPDSNKIMVHIEEQRYPDQQSYKDHFTESL